MSDCAGGETGQNLGVAGGDSSRGGLTPCRAPAFLGAAMMVARSITLLLALLPCASALVVAVAPARPVLAALAVRPLSPRMQVAEPPVKIPDKVPQLAPTEPKGDKQNQKGKKYKLLLFNDNVNRREYVARILVQNIPEITQADAYLVMQKAHKSGMAVVGVWVFEMAEAYCDTLKSGGLIASITEED